MEYRGLEVNVDPTDTWKGIPKRIIWILAFIFTILVVPASVVQFIEWNNSKAHIECSQGWVPQCEPIGQSANIKP